MSILPPSSAIPLAAEIASADVAAGYRREKVVFTCTSGERIAGWFARPDARAAPPPCILVLHSAGANKDMWWSSDNPTGPLVPRLLANGFAVFMLDAAHFGERRAAARSSEGQPAPSAIGAAERFRATIVQTTSDYRRALDYLQSRSDISIERGVVGYSLGGIIATHLFATEPRLGAAAVCAVPPMIATGNALRFKYRHLAGLVTPVDGVDLAGKPVLFILGRKDDYYALDEAEVLYSLIPGSAKRLILYEGGHRLPHAYIGNVIEWFALHLNAPSAPAT